MDKDFVVRMSLFNAVALLLMRLKRLDSEYFYRAKNLDGLHLSKENQKELDDIIEEIKACAVDKENGLSYALIHHGLPLELVDTILNERLIKNNFKAIHCLIDRLTKLIYEDDLIKYIQSMNLKGFTALNDNVDETGFLILPDLKGINEKQDAGEAEDGKDYSWADSRLYIRYTNLYFVEIEKLSTVFGRQFKIENYIMEALNLEKQPRDGLVIAASPVTYSKALLFPEQFESRETEGGSIQAFFQIAGTAEKERIYSRIEAAFLAACERKADILLLPEMLGDEVLLSEGFWKSLHDKAEDQGLRIPALTITPTWWHDNRNELMVLDSGLNRVFGQQKQFPFDFELDKGDTDSNVMEDLLDVDNTIHVMHWPGIGRLVVPICKDFLISPYRDILLRELKATVLLIPSYSFGSTQFMLSMLETMQYGCYAVWLNTCSAFFDKEQTPKIIGAAENPFRSKGKPIVTMLPTCNMKCGKDCDTCLFLIRITLEPDRSVTCKHIFFPKD